MHCASLNELPPPYRRKIGWPWTEECQKLPDRMPNGFFYPKLTIITPSFNQGCFLEETIRSVLLQGYPNLEYIIIDGGSTDNSIEIIKKYEKWISFWVSESDKGQSNAINKGLMKSSGDIVAWLNSDDVYCKDVFRFITDKMWDGRKLAREAIFGNCYIIDEKSRVLSITSGRPCKHIDVIKFWRGKFSIPQPSLFVSGKLFRQMLLNETLHYVLDWEFLIRLSKLSKMFYYDFNFAKFRHHDHSKSVESWKKFLIEREAVLKCYFKNKGKLYLLRLKIRHMIWMMRFSWHSRIRKFLKKILYLMLPDHYYNFIKKIKKYYLPFFSKPSLIKKK